MLLGEVKSQDVAFITVHPEYAAHFGLVQPPAEQLACTHDDPEKVVLGANVWEEMEKQTAA